MKKSLHIVLIVAGLAMAFVAGHGLSDVGMARELEADRRKGRRSQDSATTSMRCIPGTNRTSRGSLLIVE